MARSVILSAVRTPFAKLGGSLAGREATVGAGLPIELPSDTINNVFASSIRAVENVYQMIRSGDHDVVVVGGMESMTNAPYALKKARFGYRLGDGTLIDLMTHDGLTSTFDKRHMVQQASFVARELGIPREDQDRGALRRRDRSRRRVRSRRGAAPRHVARQARGAEARLRSRRDDDGRQRPRGQ